MPRVEHLEKIWTEYKDLFWKKLHDYGLEDIERMGALGIAMRANDKLSRIMNLIRTDSRGTIEPLRDSWLDLFGYALIGLLFHDGVWMDGSDNQPILKFKKLHKDGGLLAPQKYGDVGYDILVAENTTVPGNIHGFNVPSHVAIKVPSGFFMIIINRSSAIKRGLSIVPGIIDEGYTGPIFSVVNNHKANDVTLQMGERLAQGILLPRFTPTLAEVAELPVTERGSDGFGSTGK